MLLPPQIARRFGPLSLEKDPASIAVLNDDGVIVWVNAAWLSFGAANGGHGDPSGAGVGRRYAAAVQGEIRSWFDARLETCARTREPFELEYECSSPDVCRRFHLRALPVDGFVIMLHSLMYERPHERDVLPPIEAQYRAPNGLTTQCSNCRRFKRLEGGSWDWIPAWVAGPPARVSHGVCAACIGFYYGDFRPHAEKA